MYCNIGENLYFCSIYLCSNILAVMKGREEVYSTKIRAGKRTYFFDVHSTRADDYYITITESKKRFDGRFEKHKIFLYKEDFNKFMLTLTSVINHIKTELLPDYDYDEFDRKRSFPEGETEVTATDEEIVSDDSATDELSTNWDD